MSILNPHPRMCAHTHTHTPALIKSTITPASLSQLPSHQIHPPGYPYDCKVYGLLISHAFFLTHCNHFPFMNSDQFSEVYWGRIVSNRNKDVLRFFFITWRLVCEELYSHIRAFLQHSRKGSILNPI